MRNSLMAGLLALALIVGCTIQPAARMTLPPPAGSTIKIVLGQGHGSGVHIGNQYVVTSAHVVADVTGAVSVKADDGSLINATVLWAKTKYDVALLRLERKGNIAAASLACRDPNEGETLSSRGSPGSIEFVTTYGRVAGAPRKHAGIESVFVYDGTIGPGMSGGGVFDATGKLVGINAAIMVVPMGFGGSLLPISYVVPSSAICMLMGRTP
jgi:S1-C subfamily serine protease